MSKLLECPGKCHTRMTVFGPHFDVRYIRFSKQYCYYVKSYYQPHFREVRGDARPWLMACWKAHRRLSIRELFSLSITVITEL